MMFRDRRDAGQRLAHLLVRFQHQNPIVLALSRGGLPVGHEVARALEAPLDILVVRKLRIPGCPQFTMGAIAEGGEVFLEPVVRELGIASEELEEIAEREAVELQRQVQLYRGERTLPDLTDRIVILVDDGVATGCSARAAVRTLRQHEPRRVILAIPVIAPQSLAAVREEVDEVVYIQAPPEFIAVGYWYAEFGRTSDEEVALLLERARRSELGLRPESPTWASDCEQADPLELPPEGQATQRRERIPFQSGSLEGTIRLPARARAIVLIAGEEGAASGNPRTRYFARLLGESGLATLLLDLLPSEEAWEGDVVASRLRDVSFLSSQIIAATEWIRGTPETRDLDVGYVGTGIGAGAVLLAAAEFPEAQAIFSHSGRPEVAGSSRLAAVQAPTLLVVGGRDLVGLEVNRQALESLGCEKALMVVPGGSPRLDEPGALDAVAAIAEDWFARFLGGSPALAAQARPGGREAAERNRWGIGVSTAHADEGRVEMLVKDAMTRRAETVAPDETLQVAGEKMRILNVGALPVCESDRLVGMITDRDITIRATAMGRDSARTVVREAMTPQVIYCFEDQSLAEAARLMRDMAIRRLMVLDRGKRLVGILSVDDLVAQAREDDLAAAVIESAATVRPPAG